MALTQKWPLNLNEVVWLRNGNELSNKVISGCAVEETFERTKCGGFPIFRLNYFLPIL
jgi:hypothetical protein|tara:strand:- start:229 stop:402 length:174 start_codon:yes stop_codon:yes gene_type:complete